MTKQSEQTRRLVDHYVQELADWSRVTVRPLFGAMALYRDDRVFAMVWHGALYFKVDDRSRPDYEKAHSHPLGYTSRGEDQALKSFWEVPADVIEDNDRLRAWAERAYEAAVRASKG